MVLSLGFIASVFVLQYLSRGRRRANDIVSLRNLRRSGLVSLSASIAYCNRIRNVVISYDPLNSEIPSHNVSVSNGAHINVLSVLACFIACYVDILWYTLCINSQIPIKLLASNWHFQLIKWIFHNIIRVKFVYSFQNSIHIRLSWLGNQKKLCPYIYSLRTYGFVPV
jgi:hypothetical protein